MAGLPLDKPLILGKKSIKPKTSSVKVSNGRWVMVSLFQFGRIGGVGRGASLEERFTSRPPTDIMVDNLINDTNNWDAQEY